MIEKITPYQIYQQVMEKLIGGRSGLQEVPLEYRTVTFDLEKPSSAQKEAIELFRYLAQEDYPPSTTSVYLQGPVGRGKTHLMCAFYNALNDKIRKEDSSIQSAINIFLSEIEKTYRESTSFVGGHFKGLPDLTYDDRDFFREQAEKEYHASISSNFINLLSAIKDFTLRKQISLHYPISLYHPNTADRVFVTFEQLLGFHDKPEVLEDILRTPYLFVDDLHPKTDQTRARIIQEIIERRYNHHKSGMVVTSNLAPGELIACGGYPPEITERLTSRCAEMFTVVDISDTEDYRMKIGERKKAELMAKIKAAKKTKK